MNRILLGKLMKAGDLVALRLCKQAGKIGMITRVYERSYLAREKPELSLYQVLLDDRSACFTGSQLIMHNWMKYESR